MMNFDTFISYSSKDKTVADAACAALEAAGTRCWIAPRDIMPGSDWGSSIIEAIDHCRVMVLIFSSSANDSAQIRNEVVQAVHRGVPVVPVRIENVEPTKSLAYFMGGVHWLDALTPPIEQHLQRLADTVVALAHARANNTADPLSARTAPAAPLSGRTATNRVPPAPDTATVVAHTGLVNRGEALSGFQAVLLIACGVFLIGYSMLAADSSNSQTQIIVSAVLLISGVIGLIVALSGGLMRWFSSAGVSPALSILVAALLLTLLGTGPEDPIAAALARGNGTLEPFKRFVEDPLDDPFCFKSASCGLHWSTASLVLITYFLIAAALHMFLATRLRRRRPSQWLFPLANAAVDLALAAIILLLAEKRDTWSLLSLVVGLHLLVGGGMLAAMAFIPHIPAAGPVRAVKG